MYSVLKYTIVEGAKIWHDQGSRTKMWPMQRFNWSASQKP